MTSSELDPDHAWAHLVHSQHGLLSRRQLHEWGIDDPAIAHRLRARRWQRVLHGVHCLHVGPLTRPAILLAALLYGGPDAALSHASAGEEWGMLRVELDRPVHITVPYGRSAVDLPVSWGIPGLVHPGVVVHRSRAIAHIVVATSPPRTSRADTVVDLAVAEPRPRDAARQLVGLSTAGRVRTHELRERLALRPPPRYRRPLEDALRLMETGVQSALEHRYAVDVEGAHGLPSAERQAPVVVDGRTLWEDCDYSAAGVPLIVRLDGRRYHYAAGVPFRDRRRDNAAELAGRPRLVYGWDEVTGDSCGVAGEVRVVLQRGGWASGPRTTAPTAPRCTRCS